MRTFRKHLNTKLKDKEFKQLYEEEREMLEISIQVLNARKNMGLSQQELARKAHITQQQLSRIESGMNCNMVTFLKVCHALQVKLDLRNIEATQRNIESSLTI
ncbi:MAG: helix-turn-helix transcriptional regulator [Candidatus Aminicenantes bacterium]|jgi:transcriptional regulator with XRE-family HTH domain